MGKKIKNKAQDDVVDAAVEVNVDAVTTKKKKAALVPSSEGGNVDKTAKSVKNGTEKALKRKKAEQNGAPLEEDTDVHQKRKKKAEKNGTAPEEDTSDVHQKSLKQKKKAKRNGTAPEADAPVVQEKAQKRKKQPEPRNGTAFDGEDGGEAVPPKKAKDDGRVITAGTTIDQVPGIKLRKKKSKREKHAKFVDDRREKAKNKERDEALLYLEVWKNSRAEWKFEKLKQIYVQTHVFDEDKINGDVFPLALEYLSGMRGSSKESLKKAAEAVIKQIDASVTENGDDSAQESTKYQRARELLQSLG